MLNIHINLALMACILLLFTGTYTTLSPYIRRFLAPLILKKGLTLSSMPNSGTWVPWVCLQFVTVVFTDHTHLLFLKATQTNLGFRDMLLHLPNINI